MTDAARSLVDMEDVKALVARIAVLERQVVVTTPRLCALCGDPLDLSVPAVMERNYAVVWAGEPDDMPDHCPGCGRRQAYHIEFDKGG